MPNDRPLKKGDIVNLDITTIKDGWHGDTSRMFVVGGEASILAKRLCQVTFECLWLGIAQVRPGAHLGDIGQRSSATRSEAAFRWFASSAATASAGTFTKNRRCSTTASPAPARNCCPA